MRVYTAEITQQVSFSVQVKCEKCGHIYSCKKTLPANMSGSSSRSTSDFQLRELAKKLREEIIRKVARSGSRIGQEFEVYLPCPQCDYVQSWMQERLVGKKVAEDVGVKSTGVAIVFMAILFVIAFSKGAGFLVFFLCAIISIGIGIAAYHLYEKPQFEDQRHAFNEMRRKAGNPHALPPLKIEFLDPADEAYARTIHRSPQTSSPGHKGCSEKVFQALKAACTQGNFSEKVLPALAARARGALAEVIVALVKICAQSKCSEDALKILVARPVKGGLSDKALTALVNRAKRPGTSPEVTMSLIDAYVQHAITDETLSLLANGRAPEDGLIALVNARISRKMSKLAFESLARAHAYESIAGSEVVKLVGARVAGELSDADLIAQVKGDEAETPTQISLHHPPDHSGKKH